MDKFIRALVYVLTFATAMCLYQGELVYPSFLFTRFTQIFLPLFAVFLLIRRRVTKPDFFIVSLGIYTLWCLLSILWSWLPDFTYPASIKYVYFTIYCYIVYSTIRTRRDFENILVILTFVASIYVVGTLFNYLRHSPYMFDPRMQISSGVRYSLSIINPNYTSAVVACAMPLAWWLFYVNKRSGPFLSLCLAAFLAMAPVALLLMGSRGAIYASIVTLLYIAQTIIAEKKHIKHMVGVVSIVLVGVFIYQYSQNQGNMLKAIDRVFGSGLSVDDRNVVERIQIWKATWELFLKYPILGVGQAVIVHSDAIGAKMISHNSALGILAETGLIGFSLILVTVGVALRNALRCVPNIRLALGASVLVLVLIAFKDSFDLEGFFWLFMVLPSLALKLRGRWQPEPAIDAEQEPKTEPNTPILNEPVNAS